MTTASAAPHAPPTASAVLTKAVVRAADLLGISQRELSAIIGVSPSAITAAVRHGRPLPADAKRRELATLFLRAFRALDAIVGGDDAVAARWLREENLALAGRPLDRMKTIDGLVGVVGYLDQRRAPL